MAATARRWFEEHRLTAPASTSGPTHDPDIPVRVSPCRPVGSHGCDMAGGGWGTSHLRAAYRRAVAPVAVIVAGWWLVLLLVRPLLRRGRARVAAAWWKLPT
jgi:hypothetical protein